jgi:hypothetical protein
MTDTPPSTDSPEADTAAGVGCMAHIVRDRRFASLLPDNPTQFDYLHAIRAVSSRGGNKDIFDLADAGMFAAKQIPPRSELPEIDIQALNPRIRHTVKTLRQWGYDTRDSGDGKTHEFGCDLPCPYVHIKVAHPAMLHAEMRRLMDLLETCGVEAGMCNESGDAPTIEGSIQADMSAWLHLFNVIIPANDEVSHGCRERQPDTHQTTKQP